MRPRRLVSTRDVDGSGPAVWAVWDGEKLVGVFTKECVARGDAAVLRRDAARAGACGRSVDCLPVLVCTESQHTQG